MPFLRPDAKSQVTMRYVDGKPHSIDTVVLSSQHSPDQSETAKKMKASFTEAIIEEIIKPVLPKEWLKDTKYLINPTGRFVIGGPQGDCGLTGRKIIVDTYGGACPHGGGAFSGKDPTKVDRSAAYAARYLAKNVVAAGIADRCMIQVAYAIGRPEPMSLLVDTQGSSKHGGDIDAKRRHGNLAFIGQRVIRAPSYDGQPSLGDEMVIQGHGQRSRHVIVAGARLAQPAWRGRLELRRWRARHDQQRFQCGPDIR